MRATARAAATRRPHAWLPRVGLTQLLLTRHCGCRCGMHWSRSPRVATLTWRDMETCSQVCTSRRGACRRACVRGGVLGSVLYYVCLCVLIVLYVCNINTEAEGKGKGTEQKKGGNFGSKFKRKEKSRTTTECKGTREPFLLAPPGVWNAMVCVISSPSIETPLIFLLFFVIIIIIIIVSSLA